MKKTTQPHLVTIAEYVRLVRKTPEGKNCTAQTIHQRHKPPRTIEFVLDGITPKYKIDIRKYPPDKWRRDKPGPKKKKKK